MSDWIPIASAPRNGDLLLYLGDNAINTNDICGWHPKKWIDTVVGWWDGDAWSCGFCDEGTADTEGYSFVLNVTIHPTHWMPLPEPPK